MNRIARWSLMTMLTAVLVLSYAGTAAMAAAVQPAKVTVTRSSSAPVQYSNVTVTANVKDSSGHGVSHAKVVFTFKFQAGAKAMTVYTDSTGKAKAVRNILSAKAGYKVTVGVKATSGGKSVTGSTSFTPRALIQTASVNVASGRFAPAALSFKSGTPIKITFSRGTGCTKAVKSIHDAHSPYSAYRTLGFAYTDLQSGPKTVSITPKTAGTYIIQCWMDMQHCVVTIR